MKSVSLLAGVILCGICTLPNRAADKLWIGNVSSNWFDADNWSPPGVPATEDTVTVTKASITVTADVTVAALNFNTGTISTTNVITVTNLTWGNSPETSVGSASFSGAGRVIIPPQGTLVFRGDSTCMMRTGVVENLGHAVNTTSRGLLLFHEAVFHNAGTFEIHTNFNFDGANGPPGGVLSNSGLLVVTGETARVNFYSVRFDNSGRTELRNGIFACGSGSSMGPIDISLSATQQIIGPNFTLNTGASFPGPGILVHARGTIDAGTNDLFFPNYRFELGTLTGTNTFIISNFVWAGGTVSGNGRLRVPPLGTLHITPGNSKTLLGRELRHEGNGIQTGMGSLDVTLQSGGLFHNVGLLITTGGYWIGSGSGTRGFYNSGTLIRSNQFGETPFYTPITNAGRVAIIGGNVRPLFGYVQVAGSTELTEGTRLDSGTCLIQGGKLSGVGRITGSVVNYGELHPGNPIGTLEIQGAFTNFGRIFIDLTQNPAGMNDHLVVTATARLRGTMSVCLQNGLLWPGAAFSVINYASRTGALASIHGLDIGGGMAFVPEYSATALSLVVQNVGRPTNWLSLAPFPDGDYQVRFTGFPGLTYEIQSSENLADWTPLWTTNSATGIIYFLDPGAREHPYRFYRAARQP